MKNCKCGGKPVLRKGYDPDMCLWYNVECDSCPKKTLGKWVSSSQDVCSIFIAEVMDEWDIWMEELENE